MRGKQWYTGSSSLPVELDEHTAEGLDKAQQIPTVTAPINTLQNKALTNPTVLLVVPVPPAKNNSHSPIKVSNCIPAVSLKTTRLQMFFSQC